MRALKPGSELTMTLIVLSMLVGAASAGVAAEKAPERAAPSTSNIQVSTRIQELTAPAMQHATYRYDATRVRRLAGQLESISKDVANLENKVAATGRTSDNIRTAQKLLARLERQRAEAKELARKRAAMMKEAMKDTGENYEDAEKQLKMALRILEENQVRIHNTIFKISGK